MNATNRETKTINFMVSQDLKYVTMDEFTLPKIERASAPDQLAQSMPNVTSYTKKLV